VFYDSSYDSFELGQRSIRPEKKIEQNIEQVKAVILNNEGKEKPIWITEFGFPTGTNKDG
jgi:exo-beta-1,3-glucanase (GH17 family)